MAISFLFPGQGSQSVGMLAEICEIFPQVVDTFQEASDALGYDIWDVCQNGPEQKLNSTEVTQPALLTCSTALFRLFKSQSTESIEAVAGHSLGEYSALVASNVISLADGVRLVEARGRLMQEAVKEVDTSMAAVLGLEDDKVVEICETVAQSECVQAVNFNCPGQVVIAGHSSAVDRAIEALKSAGARRAVKLAVSVPSHCVLMKPAAEALKDNISDLKLNRPEIKIVQNVNADSSEDLEVIRDNLVKQLYSPVLWAKCMKSIAGFGVSEFAECGPGKVLAGLAKKIDRSLSVRCLSETKAWE